MFEVEYLKKFKSKYYNQKILIFIPVRMNSKRLPGKPLYKINNKVLFHHTYDQVLKNVDYFNNIALYVLSSDREIIDYCNKNKLHVIDTSIKLNNSKNKICNGTDRCAFVIKEHLNNLNFNNTIIINVQGDNYKLPKGFLNSIIKPFDKDDIYWATLITDLSLKDSISNDIVKAHIDPNINYINMFYRNLGFDSVDQYNLLLDTKHFYKHIGIYAYKDYFLKQFYNLDTSINEINLSLEQMRGLDNNYKIIGKYTQYNSISIDNYNDVIKYNINTNI
jgi:3-deoxy-manno-octulosonate cytidylyltransferase (CMP-KDO synthetase)